MMAPDDLRDLIAHHVRERVRLRLGPTALGMAALGESVMLSGVEADLVGQAAVDALAGAGLVVVSACGCGQPIGTCPSCGQPRCWHCDPGLGKGHQPMTCNSRHEPARATLPERRTETDA